MKKKILSLLVSIVFVLSIMPAVSTFENVENQNNNNCNICPMQKNKACFFRPLCIFLTIFIGIVDGAIFFLRSIGFVYTAEFLESDILDFKVLYELWCSWE